MLLIAELAAPRPERLTEAMEREFSSEADRAVDLVRYIGCGGGGRGWLGISPQPFRSMASPVEPPPDRRWPAAQDAAAFSSAQNG